MPSTGGFQKNVDETTDVDFFVGFRQDGLFAWEVKRLNSAIIKKQHIVNEPVDIEDYDQEIAEDFVESIDESKVKMPENEEQNDLLEKKVSLKVVGKIDLNQFVRKK